ncbi:hypothetical protein [Psychrobacter sp. Ps3]|uniref:hypothetical protein n=1 Tax=Psychrobacter sp. Ps3 TaxID=2790957 RepID=UPI001EDF0EEF|nr:hypothetical protein [Psychrobacter sp. Ps3]
MLHFIETPIFTKQVLKLLDDEAYKELQENLINNPEQGDLIQGTGAFEKPDGHLTKVRVAVFGLSIIL